MEYGNFIEITGEDVKKIAFVCKSVDKEKYRNLHYVVCIDNELISTDGKRMHILKLSESDKRFKNNTAYIVLKITKTVVWLAEALDDIIVKIFPNIERVIPTGTPEDSFEFNIQKNRHDISIDVAILFRHLPENSAVKLDFLKDLPDNTTYNVTIFGKAKPVVFNNGDITAYLMWMVER